MSSVSLRDEIHPIPHPLGYAGAAGIQDAPDGLAYSYDIGGLFFLSAASDDYPYQRQLRKVVKEQIDQSDNPGDNSLQDWWMRTQTDWSGGAGQEFMEPISAEGVNRKFWTSAGADVFSLPGQVRLLTKAQPLGSPLGAHPANVAKTASGFIVAVGTTVQVWQQGSPPTLTQTRTAGGQVEWLSVAGSVALLSMAGKVQQMPVDGSAAPADVYTGAGALVPRAVRAKNRVLVMAGDKVWEVPGDPTTPLDMATATPVVNLRDSTWTWVDAAETPKSILIAGHGASGSSIMALTIDPQSGNLPTLAAPTIVAELPPNEIIYALATYLGSYAVIASSAGVRVGQLDDAGGLTYGPLLHSPAMVSPTGNFSMWDRFAHYPVADAGDGRGGMVRIDLSELTQDGRAPWATFVRAGTEPVADGVDYGYRQTVMVDTAGQVWWTPEDGELEAGWLVTSKVRYGTLEGKTFHSVRVIAAPTLTGSLVTSTVIDDVVAGVIGTLIPATGPEGTFRTGVRKALTQMALRFDLTPAGTAGPVLEAWSMRALPSIEDRGEQILLPLLDFDFERDSRGVQTGYEGRAWARWRELVARLTDGTTLTIRELHSGAVYDADPEDCSFTMVSPPEHASGFGGIIQLTLRTAQ